MREEHGALASNNTWVLVPRKNDMNVVGSKWVFKTKLNVDGSVDRLKARLVAKGYTDKEGIDYDQTLSPVIKPATIRIILSLVIVRGWPIRQLDVSSMDASGKQSIWSSQRILWTTHVCCLLRKAIYGLKQTPRA